jgi:hypothetical protein
MVTGGRVDQHLPFPPSRSIRRQIADNGRPLFGKLDPDCDEAKFFAR